jgi:hypothetical protein
MYPGQMVQLYLMASWLYYWQDDSVMTDHAFDYMCKCLLAEFDNFEHIHKHLIDKESLEAGTCLLAKDAFPQRVRHAADGLLRSIATDGFWDDVEPRLKPA